MVWISCLYSEISFSIFFSLSFFFFFISFFKAAYTGKTRKISWMWSGLLHSYLISWCLSEPQALGEHHHIYRVLMIAPVVTPNIACYTSILHWVEGSAKAPRCAFSQLCCCQPGDNACSEEPSIPADAQLTPGWTSAKQLLSHFHGLCSNACCLCIHTALSNGRRVWRRAAGLAQNPLWKHRKQRDPLCRTNILLYSITAVSSRIDIVLCYFVWQTIIKLCGI